MAQYELDLRDYGRILIKRKKVIIFSTLLVGFLTFLFTPQPKPYYKARSSVRVTESSTLTGLFVQAVSYTKWNNMETQAKIITSLPVVVEAAQALGFVNPNLTPDEICRSEKDIDVINEMTKKISTEQTGKTDIIEITAIADKAELAKSFANELADAFIDFSMKQKNQSIDEAADFIQGQLDYYKVRLEDAERRLEEFKRANLDQISVTSGVPFELQSQLDNLNQRIIAIEVQLEQLDKRTASSSNSFIDWISELRGDEDPGLTEINRQLVNLQIEKESLLIYQTPNSPEVIELEEKIQKILVDTKRELNAKLQALREEAGELELRLANLPGNDLTYNRLTRDVKINEEIYSLLNDKFQEAKIKQAEKIKEMWVVERATYAYKYSQGGKWSKTILGLVVGILLGLVVAFVMETLDTSIGAIQDVEEFLKASVLGVIPHFDKESIKSKIIKNNPRAAGDQYINFYSELITQFSPKSPIAEAYRTLATNIDFFRLKNEGANEFIITSATMQEGKSTTMVNLAIAMAQMGYKTLLIGCNLRRPTLYKVFGLEIGPGVKDISLGLVDWRACVRTINDVATGMMTVTEDFLRDGAWSRLNIITCGGIYHNPTEVFSTPKMRKFLEEVKKEYDLVLIDCPPVLPVTDAAILGSKVDGCIMVYQVGKIARGALKRAKLHLESANIRVLGVVLNDFRAEISGFAPDTAYYGKYYGDGAESVQKPRYQKFLDQLSTSRERTGQMWAKISAMFRKKPPLPLVAAEEEVSRAEAVKEENAVNSNNNTGGNEEKQT